MTMHSDGTNEIAGSDKGQNHVPETCDSKQGGKDLESQGEKQHLASLTMRPCSGPW